MTSPVYSPESLFAIVKVARDEGRFVHVQPYTPPSLISEIMKDFDESGTTRIAVLFTVEWALYLRLKGYVDITVITDVFDPVTDKFCRAWGFKYLLNNQIGEDMKFDVVVGNPPFQKTFDGERKAKRYNLWSEFLGKAMTISDRVFFVIPDGWMSSGTKIFDEMKSFGIHSANIEDCGKYFNGVAVRFTTVDLKKGFTGETTITNQNKQFNVDLNALGVITPEPEVWSILQKMTSSETKMGWRRGRGYHTSNDMDVLGQTGKYEVVHTNAQTFHTDEFRGDQGKTKVIGTISGWFKPRYDTVGELGACQATAVLEMNNPELAKSVFESKLFLMFFNKIAKQQGWINLSVMKLLSDIDFTKKWTDRKLYTHFNLTKEEIEYVEANVK